MKRKMIAPIVIGIIVACYFLLWITLLFAIEFHVVTIMLAIPMIALLLLWIHVVKERVEEIRSGETDDLSKY